MSKPVNDGGPAFPTTEYYDERPYGEHPGMTLRDWFAGQALSLLNYHNILADSHDPRESALQIRNAAALSYRLADAMLAERKLPPYSPKEPVTDFEDVRRG